MSETIVFRGHHKQDRQIPPHAGSLSILRAAARFVVSALSAGRLISVSILFALPFVF